ncbi:hypothetical protein F7D13_03645 [Methylocystis rosea]|uniref:Uncharacterized protein n=1 Tax=Methylocystis rosea TaxID=173366 RepID=A0ABX6EIC8_9HYPH|nr:hypothetical protein [Methylocystis rosea]QGM93181.1 hypothetical protein F7D13_03645 [Methylocystis rosea]
MLSPQFVEGVTLKPRFMVSAWLRSGAANVIMSKLRQESRAYTAYVIGAAACAKADAKKLTDFFDENLLQHFYLERFLSIT